MIGPPGNGKADARAAAAEYPAAPHRGRGAVDRRNRLACGTLFARDVGARPYRAPPHTASAVVLVGGGSDPRPGEVSLAHHGVLFLDELPEGDRRVLEVLREPIESGVIHVSRAARQCMFPAQFQFVAAMNPCPCGWLGHESGRRRCTPERIARYRGRVSGPLLDRIDLGIEVPALSAQTMAARADAIAEASAGTSANVRAQAIQARDRQSARQGKPNARLMPREIDAHRMPAGSSESDERIARAATGR